MVRVWVRVGARVRVGIGLVRGLSQGKLALRLGSGWV